MCCCWELAAPDCCSAAIRHTHSFPRRITRPDFDDLAPRNEGMARRKAQNLWCPHPLPDAAGASRRASGGSFPASGPAFQLGHRAQVGRRPVAQKPKSSASSWQGLLVVPGGAPARRPKAFLGRAEIVMLWAAGRCRPSALLRQGPRAPHLVPLSTTPHGDKFPQTNLVIARLDRAIQ
jgi:hypothetical protein